MTPPIQNKKNVTPEELNFLNQLRGFFDANSELIDSLKRKQQIPTPSPLTDMDITSQIPTSGNTPVIPPPPIENPRESWSYKYSGVGVTAGEISFLIDGQGSQGDLSNGWDINLLQISPNDNDGNDRRAWLEWWIYLEPNIEVEITDTLGSTQRISFKIDSLVSQQASSFIYNISVNNVESSFGSIQEQPVYMTIEYPENIVGQGNWWENQIIHPPNTQISKIKTPGFGYIQFFDLPEAGIPFEDAFKNWTYYAERSAVQITVNYKYYEQ